MSKIHKEIFELPSGKDIMCEYIYTPNDNPQSLFEEEEIKCLKEHRDEIHHGDLIKSSDGTKYMYTYLQCIEIGNKKYIFMCDENIPYPVKSYYNLSSVFGFDSSIITYVTPSKLKDYCDNHCYKNITFSDSFDFEKIKKIPEEYYISIYAYHNRDIHIDDIKFVKRLVPIDSVDESLLDRRNEAVGPFEMVVEILNLHTNKSKYRTIDTMDVIQI